MGFETWKKIQPEKFRESCAIGGIIGASKNIKALYTKYGDGSKAPLCKCGCEKPVTRSKLYPFGWNKYIHNHHPNGGGCKEWLKSNPNHMSDMVKKAHKDMKENDPIKYSRLQSKKAKDFHRKNPNFASENSKKIHKMYPDLGRRCYEGRLRNCPWPFMGVGFGSRQESDIAKFRFKLLGIVPIKGENCHIQISRNEFDFEQLGFIHEHHPEQQYESYDDKEDYYKERREILDSNGHKKSPLVVTTNVSEAKRLYMWLNKNSMINIKGVE